MRVEPEDQHWDAGVVQAQAEHDLLDVRAAAEACAKQVVPEAVAAQQLSTELAAAVVPGERVVVAAPETRVS